MVRYRRFPSAIRAALSVLCTVAGLALERPADAQTLTLYGGTVHAPELRRSQSFTFALDYVEPVSDHLAIGVLYLNEGHHDDHHRDGYAAQLWWRTAPLARGLRLAVGAGPYYHFDTATVQGSDYANRHGWGVVYSVAASVPFAQRWSAQLRFNRVVARDRFDTNVALLGIGYQFDAKADERAAPDLGRRRHREITFLAGQTILNSFESERDTALSFEYRHTVSSWFDWSAAWLNEGEPRFIDRKGLAAQAWLARSAFGDRLRFGIGLGPYFALDRRHAALTGESERQLAGLVSLTARYRVAPQWHVRATWHRVLADYHRDTDVVLLGAGYSF